MNVVSRFGVKAGGWFAAEGKGGLLTVRVKSVDVARKAVEIEAGGVVHVILPRNPATISCGSLWVQVLPAEVRWATSVVLRAWHEPDVTVKPVPKPPPVQPPPKPKGPPPMVEYGPANPRKADPETEQLARRYLAAWGAKEDSAWRRLVMRQWWDTVRRQRAVVAGGHLWVYSRSEDRVKRLPPPAIYRLACGSRPALL